MMMTGYNSHDYSMYTYTHTYIDRSASNYTVVYYLVYLAYLLLLEVYRL